MKAYKVSLTPDAISDLENIYLYIAEKSELPEVAWAYMQRLEKACYSLETVPLRGQRRDDLRKNLRIVPIDKNAVAAFEVDVEKQNVTILNIFYGGQDYDTIMKNS
ncbi:MAG: type II toxin-antitoxin system RelE/ParE family toxin [Methylococcaceae bacterium]|nr:type II toxin-antitoxin system RelE/ParE family toxin [Methylococcaceae bacterium]